MKRKEKILIQNTAVFDCLQNILIQNFSNSIQLKYFIVNQEKNESQFI